MTPKERVEFFATRYPFNVESTIAPQLTAEQQEQLAKELERAYIAGAECLVRGRVNAKVTDTHRDCTGEYCTVTADLIRVDKYGLRLGEEVEVIILPNKEWKGLL